MDKKCTKCKLEQSEDNFRWRNKKKGWRQPWCKDCFSKYEHTIWKTDQKRRKDHKITDLKNKKRNNQFLWDYKKEHPCVDCGEKDPLVLEFDHKKLKTKKRNLADFRRFGCSIESLLKEINKCDIRCANCHRRRTAKQLGWYKEINRGMI